MTLIELLRLPTRHAQGYPLRRFQMLGQKNNLTNVRGVVRQLAIDGLDDGMGFPANYHLSDDILRREWFERAEQALPPLLPPAHHIVASRTGIDDELLIAEPIGLFAIGCQKVGPTRTHISREMLDEHRDTVTFRIDRHKKLLRIELPHCAISLFLEQPKFCDYIFQVMLGCVVGHTFPLE